MVSNHHRPQAVVSQMIHKIRPSVFSLKPNRPFNPLPDDKILDWSKSKQSADDNFEFDVNSRKFSKLVENTVSKGEIALYEQFLLFPQCFQKACFPGASKGVIVWEWVNPLPDDKILGLPKFKALADDKSNVTQNIKVVFHRIENIMGKGENAGYQHLPFFSTMFSKGFFLQCFKSHHYVIMG